MQYVHESVKVIRGREGKTEAERSNAGWELVPERRLLAAAGGVLALVVVIGIAVAATAGGGEPAPTEHESILKVGCQSHLAARRLRHRG